MAERRNSDRALTAVSALPFFLFFLIYLLLSAFYIEERLFADAANDVFRIQRPAAQRNRVYHARHHQHHSADRRIRRAQLRQAQKPTCIYRARKTGKSPCDYEDNKIENRS